MSLFFRLGFIIIAFMFHTSCNDIKQGKDIKEETLELIKSIGLLDNDEEIIQYYSNFKEANAGNFYTNKRVAHYWLEKSPESPVDKSYAYYPDIVSIDTILTVSWPSAPFMKITKNDDSSFKIYGNDNDLQKTRAFFEGILNFWKLNNK